MPVMPNVVERLTFQLNLGPAPMLDLLGALGFRATCAAYRLWIFDVLRSAPATAAEVARKIEADERGTGLLLESLEALGYVKKRDDNYRLTPMSGKVDAHETDSPTTSGWRSSCGAISRSVFAEGAPVQGFLRGSRPAPMARVSGGDGGVRVSVHRDRPDRSIVIRQIGHGDAQIGHRDRPVIGRLPTGRG